MDTDSSSSRPEEALKQKAKDTLARCGNCAQTSFAVLQEELDLPGGAILKALTPFPGIALRGETCGAVVGCLMAIGLVYGRDDLDDWDGFTNALRPARKFCRRFEAMHETTSCAKLHKLKLGRAYDLADMGETYAYVTAGGPEACGEIVASAVEVAAEIIAAKG